MNSPEDPNIPNILNDRETLESTQEESFRLAVRALLTEKLAGRNTGDIQTFIKAQVELPLEVGNQIIVEEKKLAMGLPDSLFISDEAFNRLKDQWKDRRLEFTDMARLRKNEDEALCEMADMAGRYGFEEYFWNIDEEVIIYRNDGKVKAFTSFTDVKEKGRIGIKIALQIKLGENADEAGAGIAMIDRLIRKIKGNEGSAEFITLNTLKRPSGLGNLGFRFIEDASLGTYKYRMSLRNPEDGQ